MDLTSTPFSTYILIYPWNTIWEQLTQNLLSEKSVCMAEWLWRRNCSLDNGNVATVTGSSKLSIKIMCYLKVEYRLEKWCIIRTPLRMLDLSVFFFFLTQGQMTTPWNCSTWPQDSISLFQAWYLTKLSLGSDVPRKVIPQHRDLKQPAAQHSVLLRERTHILLLKTLRL